jgi:cell wall-associated NlpC family hydrolase
MLASLLTVMLAASPAQAFAGTPGDQALNWAENHALGHSYGYGGIGPAYDCSGLIVAAFGNADGIWLPHSTYLIPGNPHVHWIPLSQARRGDILAFGTGHMEMDTIWYHVSFGAHSSGTTVGWRGWNGYYAPTAAYRVW